MRCSYLIPSHERRNHHERLTQTLAYHQSSRRLAVTRRNLAVSRICRMGNVLSIAEDDRGGVWFLMWTVHQRMAELTTINKKRPLTESELEEMAHCLEANANRAWKMALLENFSLMASMTNDTSWNMEICAEIEKLNV